MKNVDAWLRELCARVAQDWFVAACANPFETFYLHYLPPSGAEPGTLSVFSGDADTSGWVLARPERLSGAWTRAQVVAWIYETARRLPILPTEEK